MPGEDFDGEARILFDGVSQGGDDGLVSLCLDEADEIHEWESNPLLLQIQRYVKKRVVG